MAAESSNFGLRYAAHYLGANSRAELLPSPRANARTTVRAVARGPDSVRTTLTWRDGRNTRFQECNWKIALHLLNHHSKNIYRI